MTGHIDVITSEAMKAHRATPAAAPTPTPTAPAADAIQVGVKGNELAYDQQALTARAGEVTIELTNESPIPHDIAIKGAGVAAKGPIVTGGDHSTVRATLEPGTYTFYCTVPGHEAAGMHGTLTVKP